MVDVLALLADLAFDGASIAVFVLFGYLARSWFLVVRAGVGVMGKWTEYKERKGLPRWL